MNEFNSIPGMEVRASHLSTWAQRQASLSLWTAPARAIQ